MIKNTVFSMSLFLFISLPYKINFEVVKDSLLGGEEPNEVAYALYMLYETIVHSLT